MHKSAETGDCEPMTGESLRRLYRRGVRVRMHELRPDDVFVVVDPGWCRPQTFRAVGWPDVSAGVITCKVLK